MSTTYWCPQAWLPDGPAPQVRITETDGLISRVAAGESREPDDVVLPGLVLPGLANAHSHAFHRALRGRTQVTRRLLDLAGVDVRRRRRARPRPPTSASPGPSSRRWRSPG